MLERLREAVSVSDDDEATRLVRCRIDEVEAAITAWINPDGVVAPGPVFPLTRFMGDVSAGPLFTE